jgi:hypothetical protein
MSAKRVALVIGNSVYGDGNDVSGVEDAKAMADCLRGIGFSVPPELLVLDGTLDTMGTALDFFRDQIADASVVVFFYSGHGFQLLGKNFLQPTDGSVSQTRAFAVDKIIQRLSAAPDAVKFVFQDACRDNKKLKPEDLKGLANPGPPVLGLVQCFAASPGQLAASGSVDGRSPYTAALLKYLPNAGLELNNLFAKVHADVPPTQEPIFVTAELPAGFVFRDPIPVHAVIPGGHSSLLVFLRSKLILDTDQPVTQDLLLNAGDNDLVLLVSAGKTHHNNHDWDITEGWSYQLDLSFLDGTTTAFAGMENIQFKDGPHFGKVFQVAQVNMHVDEQNAQLKLVGLDNDVANREAPFFAKDQEILFQATIADLNLSPDDVFADAVDLGSAGAILQPFLIELLKSGTILGVAIADPTRTTVNVLGNKALRDLAVACMGNRDERIRDLKASIAAAFQRKPTPFDVFDQGLMASMRLRAQTEGSSLKPEDIRIWTALHDNSQDLMAATTAAPVAVEASPAA